jgi:uncharacterized Rossmann fold enzyme
MSGVHVADLIGLQDRVRDGFGWAHDDDVESARALVLACEHHPKTSELGWSRTQRGATLEHLTRSLNEAQHIVFVGADAATSDLTGPWPDATVFIAADGAVGACLGTVEPLCVVTDLDGGEHLERAVHSGVPLVMHAHGDNRAAWADGLRRWEPHAPPLVLTHQTRETIEGMHNPGGFTDGDRAVCFVRWLGVSVDEAVFVGYSDSRVGPWSAVTQPERKLQKLAWMANILDMVAPHWRAFTDASEIQLS